ncbi:MAG: ribosomal RNA small subunit methyltransferase A [Clostridia bacterium]|nr:ribosomal RNA small subunit methyltransferase A [Clostridia bacterium]
MTDFSKDFKFKKQFGQNFILDKNFMTSLVRDFNLDGQTLVLEIGAGAGVLTEVLSENFKKVISFEIDKTLTEHLQNIESKHNNLKFVFKDILSVETQEVDDMFNGQEYALIANLPYYITSQIIFKFLFASNVSKMYVMVQKEVGVRFCAKNSTKDYGIPTVLIDSFGSCKIVRNVSRTVFKPIPNVDSCIIKIEKDKNKFSIKDNKKYIEFVSNSFKMKRKTLYNNLTTAGYEKEKVISSIKDLGLTETVRPENLTAEQFVLLFNKLS